MRLRTSQTRRSTIIPTALALAIGAGWAYREVAHAHDRVKEVASQTVNLEQVAMEGYKYEGVPVGKAGAYVMGDTQGSTKFITGRFILDPGKSPHPPHVHAEEEVMIIESGQGEILCAGKTTKIGPGSVMYSEPNVAHGINNTGTEPIVFYFVKWSGKGADQIR